MSYFRRSGESVQLNPGAPGSSEGKGSGRERCSDPASGKGRVIKIAKRDNVVVMHARVLYCLNTCII